jgi:hypothetical protein
MPTSSAVGHIKLPAVAANSLTVTLNEQVDFKPFALIDSNKTVETPDGKLLPDGNEDFKIIVVGASQLSTVVGVVKLKFGLLHRPLPNLIIVSRGQLTVFARVVSTTVTRVVHLAMLPAESWAKRIMSFTPVSRQ